MSQAGEDVYRTRPIAGKEVTRYEDAGGEFDWADLRSVTDWARNNRVLVIAVVIIALQLAWKAQFLSHMYFRQDDFHDLDLAIESPFSWSYLTFIGAGHLIIGLRVVAWFLVRTTLYNWALASAISLALVTAAIVAALRLLRMLFGDRPAILIPLVIYAFSPLTMPDLGEWSSALESVPLQLALFMALHAHVCYVRTGRGRHLAVSAAWIAFGLLFFEKGLVLPALLFALTAGFLVVPRRTWLAGMASALVRYWRAWLLYGLIMVGYVVLLAQSLHTSTTHPRPPESATAVTTFAGRLLRDSLLPGTVGGPWQWLPVSGGSYSFAAPPYSLGLVALVVVIVVVGLSVWRRPIAWRSWALLFGWVALADMLPVVISRIGDFSPAVLGTETRYIADAMPVVALCVALAFWPLTGDQPEPHARGTRTAPTSGRQPSFEAAAVLMSLVLFGSIWSVQAYENVTSGRPYAAYIANATAAIRLAPRGAPVMNVAVPGDMVEGLFGPYALQSIVIGDIQRGKLRWTRSPAGTIDGLRMFGADGRLYQAHVSGAKSVPLAAGQKCWPIRHNRVVVLFAHPSPSYTGMLRIGYFWSSAVPGRIDVLSPGGTRTVTVLPGLHSAYVPINGTVSRIAIDARSGRGLCVGDAQAGNLGPDPKHPALPARPQ